MKKKEKKIHGRTRPLSSPLLRIFLVSLLPTSLLRRTTPRLHGAGPCHGRTAQDHAVQDLAASSSDGRALVFPAFLLQRLRLGPRRLLPLMAAPSSSSPSASDVPAQVLASFLLRRPRLRPRRLLPPRPRAASARACTRPALGSRTRRRRTGHQQNAAAARAR